MRMRRTVSPRGVVHFSGESSGRCGELVLSYNLSQYASDESVCVPCSASVHVRKSVCACGHVFASIKSSPLVTKTSKRVAIDRRRTLESEDEIAARKAKTALEKQRNVPQGSFCRVIEHVLPKREPLKHRR